MDHHKMFGKDLCIYRRTQSENVHARESKLHMFIFASCMHVKYHFVNIFATEAWIFMKFQT